MRTVIGGFHDNVPGREDRAVVVDQHCQLLLLGLRQMRRLPSIVDEHVGHVLRDGDGVVRVGDCHVRELKGRLLRVPLRASAKHM